MPSFVPSLALVNSGHHSGSEGWSALTAKPWFWEVIKHLPVPSCVHGWLTPRLPYFILKVVNCAANARSWCPRQMPKMGLVLDDNKRRRLPIVSSHCEGSPGPLLMNNPSYSEGFNGWFHGTRSTRAPRDKKHRSWWYLSPQSIAQIRGLPSGLYVCGV